MPVTSSANDGAILMVTQTSWSKVAMIIMKAAERLGPALREGDPGYEMVAERVEALVKAGRLASQGKLSRWRHSEIRLP